MTASQLSTAERLAEHINSVPLSPNMLPNPARTQGGKISINQPISAPKVHTVMRAIGLKARLNMMTYETEFALEGWAEKTSSETYLALLVHACQRCGMKGSSQAIARAADNAAASDMFHPVLDWIDSAKWDGTDRIQALCDTLALQDKTHEAWRDRALRRFLKQLYKAVTNWKQEVAAPIGFCLVLQGAEDANKSFWVRHAVLPATWTTDGMTLHLDFHERDAVKRATMTPLTELAEVDATFKKSDVAALKNFLTTTTDIYRHSHMQFEDKRPRSTAFVATVNPKRFLIDPSGERRFWTLPIERCTWQHGIDLQQLWAQVKVICQKDPQYWLDDEEKVMHAAISGGHRADSVAEAIASKLEYLAGAGVKEIHQSAKAIIEGMGYRDVVGASHTLNTRLGRCKWARSAKVQGTQGWWIPSYQAPLTPKQEQSFEEIKKNGRRLRTVEGGKAG